ncbi:MAG: hypothetical protein BWX45_00660 [Deltaproteobacteria bacterium ADurb.Bin002]|nr:MAG: hypothetical protein BWX45_00660 [Deltaproteobacteria bacterium ADurb.Bin002]
MACTGTRLVHPARAQAAFKSGLRSSRQISPGPVSLDFSIPSREFTSFMVSLILSSKKFIDFI